MVVGGSHLTMISKLYTIMRSTFFARERRGRRRQSRAGMIDLARKMFDANCRITKTAACSKASACKNLEDAETKNALCGLTLSFPIQKGG